MTFLGASFPILDYLTEFIWIFFVLVRRRNGRATQSTNQNHTFHCYRYSSALMFLFQKNTFVVRCRCCCCCCCLTVVVAIVVLQFRYLSTVLNLFREANISLLYFETHCKVAVGYKYRFGTVCFRFLFIENYSSCCIFF